MNGTIRINKYMPIALLYFFFNSFLLPHGLLYTTILSPFFLLWLYGYPTFRHLWLFFLYTVPFVIVHLWNGVDLWYYIQSYILLFSVFIFGLAFFQFLLVCKSLRSIFRNLVIINFILAIFAIIALFIPAISDRFWLGSALSSGIEGIRRLMLFTYEPSYYSTILTPLALYYYLKAFLKKLPNPAIMLIIVTVPLLLSFSFGVILAMMFAILLLLLFNAGTFFSKKMTAIYIIVGLMIAVVVFIVLILLYPDNAFFQRILNVFQGRDSSFRGRTSESFMFAEKIASMKSLIWGSGLGQTKVLGLEMWREYYAYDFTIKEIAIPNVMAETFAVFGVLGVAIRLALEIYFFFKTKVYSNYYRFALFTFVFIYQFTGSYIYNIAEIVVWILAFTNVFPEFDKTSFSKRFGLHRRGSNMPNSNTA